MAAKMATYIARNKMSPPSEWQVTVKVVEDPSNPFRILHGIQPSSVERQPHPMLNKRFPLVMMLEPLHACNLTCTGCGRIREYGSCSKIEISLRFQRHFDRGLVAWELWVRHGRGMMGARNVNDRLKTNPASRATVALRSPCAAHRHR